MEFDGHVFNRVKVKRSIEKRLLNFRGGRMTGIYEKVIKVKADVAAVLDCTAQHRIDIVSLPPF
jgi:hypothetical protein